MRRTDVLPDYLGPNLRAVFCGTAAGTTSAARRHYYAGPGNLFWRYLFDSGLITIRLTPEDDRRILNFRFGLTDLVKGTAASSDRGLTGYDVGGFIAKVDRYQPAWIAFHGKKAAEEVSKHLRHGGYVEYGKQDWDVGPSAVFVLPSASGSNQDPENLAGRASRLEWFREFAALVPPL